MPILLILLGTVVCIAAVMLLRRRRRRRLLKPILAALAEKLELEDEFMAFNSRCEVSRFRIVGMSSVEGFSFELTGSEKPFILEYDSGEPVEIRFEQLGCNHYRSCLKKDMIRIREIVQVVLPPSLRRMPA